MATSAAPAVAQVLVPDARYRPRATLRGAYVVRASGEVLVKVASNARRVTLTYRTAEGTRQTSVIVIRDGHGRKTLRQGSMRISAKAQSTRRLRASHWIRIRPADVSPVTPPPQGDVTAPGPVTDLVVYAVTESSVSLSWANPDDADLAEVVVRRAEGPAAPPNPGAGDAVALSDPRATSVTDKALAADAQYSYAVFTRDASGNTNPTPATVTTTAPPPASGPPVLNPQTITAGWRHTCGIDTSGAAWCWGLDEMGQLGDGDDGQALEFAPVPVVGGHVFVTLSASVWHTCGIDTSGAAWCWGRDDAGQLGDGDDGQALEFAPVPVVGGHVFVTLSAGGYHTCGIDTSGAAWCWGDDPSGALGDGDVSMADKYAPVPVSGGHTFTTVTTGMSHTCGLDTSGAAWCWGSDVSGQVGDGHDDGQGDRDEYAPVPVVGRHTFTKLTAGGWHTCGIDTSGAAWCWGDDPTGALGDGDVSMDDEHAPVPVVGGHVFATLTANESHTCGIDTSGAAWCWGWDLWGALGDGDDDQGDEYAPIPVVGEHTFATLTAGYAHTCGIDPSGAAWCWGGDYDGQLGDGDDGQAPESAPVQVVGGHTFETPPDGGNHS